MGIAQVMHCDNGCGATAVLDEQAYEHLHGWVHVCRPDPVVASQLRGLGLARGDDEFTYWFCGTDCTAAAMIAQNALENG